MATLEQTYTAGVLRGAAQSIIDAIANGERNGIIAPFVTGDAFDRADAVWSLARVVAGDDLDAVNEMAMEASNDGSAWLAADVHRRLSAVVAFAEGLGTDLDPVGTAMFALDIARADAMTDRYIAIVRLLGRLTGADVDVLGVTP